LGCDFIKKGNVPRGTSFFSAFYAGLTAFVAQSAVTP
jgi:hypothetical protein